MRQDPELLWQPVYYPTVVIPDETLTYSLLFRDRIHSISPSASVFARETVGRQNAELKIALGYDFIVAEDTYSAAWELGDAFSEFVTEASSRDPAHFEPLLGPNYRERFRREIKTSGSVVLDGKFNLMV